MQGSIPARGGTAASLFAAFAYALMTTWFVRGVDCEMVSALWRKRVHWRPIYPYSSAGVNDFFEQVGQIMFNPSFPRLLDPDASRMSFTLLDAQLCTLDVQIETAGHVACRHMKQMQTYAILAKRALRRLL